MTGATSPSIDLEAIRAWVPLLDREFPYALTLPEQRQLGSDLAVLCDRVEALENDLHDMDADRHEGRS